MPPTPAKAGTAAQKRHQAVIMAQSSGDTQPIQHLVGVEDAVAHLVCTVEEMRELEGQWLCTARIQRVFVRPEYWNGKVFLPRRADTPPYLSFIGSQRFAYQRADGVSLPEGDDEAMEEQSEEEEEEEEGDMPGLDVSPLREVGSKRKRGREDDEEEEEPTARAGNAAKKRR